MSRIGDFIPRSSGSPPHSPPTRTMYPPMHVAYPIPHNGPVTYVYSQGSYSPTQSPPSPPYFGSSSPGIPVPSNTGGYVIPNYDMRPGPNMPSSAYPNPVSMSGPVGLSSSPGQQTFLSLSGPSVPTGSNSSSSSSQQQYSHTSALIETGPAPLQSTLAHGAPTDETVSTSVRDIARKNAWPLQLGAPETKWTGLDMSGVGLVRLPANFASLFAGITQLYLGQNSFTVFPEAVLEMRSLRVLHLDRNAITTIPSGIAYLRELTTLNLAANKLVSLPAELGACFRLTRLDLGENPTLVPWFSQNLPDVDASDTVKVAAALLNSREFLPSPELPENCPVREWFYKQEVNEDKKKGGENGDKDEVRLRLVSYNVLADMYCSQMLYRYCPGKWLERGKRTEMALAQVEALDADIIALQEVDCVSYEVFARALRERGYEGCFEQKTRAYVVGEERRNLDGSATFWRSSKLRLAEKEEVVSYHALAQSRFRDVSNIDMSGITRLRQRDHIALMTVLEVLPGASAGGGVRRSGARILVSNTHIFWNPQAPEVKLMQCQFQIEEALAYRKRLAAASSQEDAASMPIVFMGDYNSTPESAVYQLFSTGAVPPDHQDWNRARFPPYTDKGIDNGVVFTSAYAATHEPPYTNYANDYLGTLDYIWLSPPPTFRVANTLSVVDINSVHPLLRPFPSPAFPSDHVPIAADVYLSLKS